MLSESLDYMNMLFTFLFTLEVTLKFIAFGCRVTAISALFHNTPNCIIAVPIRVTKIMIVISNNYDVNPKAILTYKITILSFYMTSYQNILITLVVWFRFFATLSKERVFENNYLSVEPDQSYFKDGWNMFDFVTVVGSIVDALMVEFAVSHCIIEYYQPHCLIEMYVDL